MNHAGFFGVYALIAFLHIAIPFQPLHSRRSEITMLGKSAMASYNTTLVENSCSPTPSNAISVYEPCLGGDECDWSLEMRGPAIDMFLIFLRHKVTLHCEGRDCPLHTTQAWRRYPYFRFQVEVLSFTGLSIDNASEGASENTAPQLALLLGAGWAPSKVPVQQRHQLTPNSWLESRMVHVAAPSWGIRGMPGAWLSCPRPISRLRSWCTTYNPAMSQFERTCCLMAAWCVTPTALSSGCS